MNEVTVKIRVISEGEFLNVSEPKRVYAKYLGRHQNIMLCLRVENEEYIVFEPCTGKIVYKGADELEVISEAKTLIDKYTKPMKQVIKKLAPLYGIKCFIHDDKEILTNTLIDPKVYMLTMKRTNGRYKEIADKILGRVIHV